MIERLSRAARRGPAGVIRGIMRRLTPERLQCARGVARLVHGRRGLEIGGPTALFNRQGLLPIYAAAASIDNVNFSSQTLWEGTIEAGETYRYDPDKPPGRQFIGEAASLTAIADGAYDFLASSHTLEHTANALGTLREWLRVIAPDGVLILVVPHKDGTFDHRRPVTTLEHLIDDEKRGMGEDDLSHLSEVLALHDLSLDAPAGTPEQFRARSEKNFENRALHHHVFDTPLAAALVDHVGLQIRFVEAALAHHIFVIAQKSSGAVDNSAFLGAGAAYRSRSPFTSDRA